MKKSFTAFLLLFLCGGCTSSKEEPSLLKRQIQQVAKELKLLSKQKGMIDWMRRLGCTHGVDLYEQMMKRQPIAGVETPYGRQNLLCEALYYDVFDQKNTQCTRPLLSCHLSLCEVLGEDAPELGCSQLVHAFPTHPNLDDLDVPEY